MIRKWIENRDKEYQHEEDYLLPILDSGVVQNTDRHELVKITVAQLNKMINKPW